jgi:hypothetical protein
MGPVLVRFSLAWKSGVGSGDSERRSLRGSKRRERSGEALFSLRQLMAIHLEKYPIYANFKFCQKECLDQPGFFPVDLFIVLKQMDCRVLECFVKWKSTSRCDSNRVIDMILL